MKVARDTHSLRVSLDSGMFSLYPRWFESRALLLPVACAAQDVRRFFAPPLFDRNVNIFSILLILSSLSFVGWELCFSPFSFVMLGAMVLRREY